MAMGIINHELCGIHEKLALDKLTNVDGVDGWRESLIPKSE
jgi:hypothetical protein